VKATLAARPASGARSGRVSGLSGSLGDNGHNGRRGAGRLWQVWQYRRLGVVRRSPWRALGGERGGLRIGRRVGRALARAGPPNHRDREPLMVLVAVMALVERPGDPARRGEAFRAGKRRVSGAPGVRAQGDKCRERGERERLCGEPIQRSWTLGSRRDRVSRVLGRSRSPPLRRRGRRVMALIVLVGSWRQVSVISAGGATTAMQVRRDSTAEPVVDQRACEPSRSSM
jgi:hypothetical protein